MTKFKLSHGASVAALAFSVVGSAAAQAQDAAAGSTSATEAAPSDEIIVTALKRSQSVQEVPASITALSGDAIASQGIMDIRDLSKVVPSLNWGEHFGASLITIRGVGSNVDSGLTEPTVAVYVDGVFLPRSTMQGLHAVDLERVEVLRGPQGTLYGRNATGGAINFVSATPSRELSGAVNLSTGSRDAWGVSGFLSGPIANGVYVRVSGGREKQDGYVRNLNNGQTINGVDSTYVRGAIRLEPTSALTVDLTASWDRSRVPYIVQQYFVPSALAGPDGQTTEPNRVVADYPSSGYTRTTMVYGKVNWEASENLTVRSLTSYVDHVSHQSADADETTTDFYYVRDFTRPSRSYSQQFEIAGDYDKFNFILGAFYFKEDSEVTLPVVFGTVGNLVTGLPVGTEVRQGVRAHIKNYALFGDATASLTDRLRLNVGLRYNIERNSYQQLFSLLPVAGLTTFDYKVRRNKLLPKVALQFDVAEGVNAYAQWSRGYKSGGANLAGFGDVPLGSAQGLYSPEEIDAFEVGLKSEFWDRRATLNLAAFYYNYRDLQVTLAIPPNSTIVQNADARIWGLEGELTLRPIDNLVLKVAPTYLHGRYKDFVAFDPVFQRTVNLDNSPVLRSPDFTVNASADYTVELGGDLLNSVTLGGSVFHSSRSVMRYFNNPGESQEPYTVANFSISLDNAAKTIRLSAFLNNAFNEKYKQNITNFGLGLMGNYGPPRTWGTRLSLRF